MKKNIKKLLTGILCVGMLAVTSVPAIANESSNPLFTTSKIALKSDLDNYQHNQEQYVLTRLSTSGGSSKSAYSVWYNITAPEGHYLNIDFNYLDRQESNKNLYCIDLNKFKNDQTVCDTEDFKVVLDHRRGKSNKYYLEVLDKYTPMPGYPQFWFATKIRVRVYARSESKVFDRRTGQTTTQTYWNFKKKL